MAAITRRANCRAGQNNSNRKTFSMKSIGLLGLFLCAVAAGGWYFFIRASSPSADDVLTEIRKTLPDDQEIAVALSGCHFSLGAKTQIQGTNQATGTTEQLAVSRVEADLSLFRADRANIRPIAGNRAVLTLETKPVANDTLLQAEALVQRATEHMPPKEQGTLTLLPKSGGQITHTPLETDADKATQRQALRKMLEQPNGQLTFRMTSMVTISQEGEAPQPMKPHEDAPKFHAFAQDLLADAEFRNYALTLLYLSEAPKADSLLTGFIAFPPRVQFAAASEDDAKRLAQRLLGYMASHCR